MRDKTLNLTADEWMGMYHIAADRADKAEAEVERLTDLLDHYNAKCAICDCSDDVTVLQAENAKLQLALKKACDMLPACPDELGRLDDMFLRAAERDLRELEG